MQVKLLDSDAKESVARWNEFVYSSAEASFFHRAEWQTIIRSIFRHPTYFLYAENNGDIVGILPLAHVNSYLFGNSLVSLPFAVYGGVASAQPEAIAILEQEAQALSRRLNVDHLEFRNIAPRHTDWPTQDLYVTFRKEILPDVESNMQAIPRKQRAMVRKGINNGLKSTIDNNADRFFKLFADNVHRHGTPALPKRYFDTLLETFGKDCEVLTVTSPEGLPLSSVLSFYFRDEVLPYYAGDDETARQFAANDFKYWELMRQSCERGLKVFDYGRSKKGTGPYSFKKNWGFEPEPLHYEYCLYKRASIPQNNPSNAKYRLFIEAWRRLPIGIANSLGPLIVRNLG